MTEKTRKKEEAEEEDEEEEDEKLQEEGEQDEEERRKKTWKSGWSIQRGQGRNRQIQVEEHEKQQQQRHEKDEQREELKEQFFHDETPPNIAFLELTSGVHITVSKYRCSWNDRRQPVFVVTPLFSCVYFIARLGRHFRYWAYGSCEEYNNMQA